jgi:hypothetical protein
MNKVICPGEPTERAIFLGVMKNEQYDIYKYIFMVGLCKKIPKKQNKKCPLVLKTENITHKKAKKPIIFMSDE